MYFNSFASRARSVSIRAVSDHGGGSRGVYSIGAVAQMLGIAVATIRNWEERYATIVPERSPGGHRLYSRDDVEQLRFTGVGSTGTVTLELTTPSARWECPIVA